MRSVLALPTRLRWVLLVLLLAAAGLAVTRLVPAQGAPGDPVVTAAGDISPARIGNQERTSDRVLAIDPTLALTLGDNQYRDGGLAEFRAYYDPTWGRFKAKTRPVPGNHEYRTPGADGY